MQWGLSVPYLISGVRNEHPKDAMAWEDAGKSKDGLGFYNKFVAADAAKAGGDLDLPETSPEGPRVPNHDSELYRKEFHTYKPMIKVDALMHACMGTWVHGRTGERMTGWVDGSIHPHAHTCTRPYSHSRAPIHPRIHMHPCTNCPTHAYTPCLHTCIHPHCVGLWMHGCLWVWVWVYGCVGVCVCMGAWMSGCLGVWVCALATPLPRVVPTRLPCILVRVLRAYKESCTMWAGGFLTVSVWRLGAKWLYCHGIQRTRCVGPPISPLHVAC